ncbi:MAG TPA: trimethylamine methyltransferase family protein [Desulfotignum sp.]|nr:trimethylamine methyltransferase family protein [Desulfotignum sp.]
MFDLTPRTRVMSLEQLKKIHHHALKILWETGIKVDDPGARKLFEKNLGKSAQNHIVHIPENIVQWAVDTAPARIQVYDRQKQPCFVLNGGGDQETVFGIGVTNLQYHDPFTNDIQPFLRHHMGLAAGLGHTLKQFDVVSTPGVIQDLPPETADTLGVLEMLAHTTKPLVMLISNPDCFATALDLCEHLTRDLSDHPFVIPYVNPITPLVLNAETTQKMDLSIQKGLPFIFSNYGMSGATCPITPGGTLALLTAELLAGLVYSQLVKQGAPVILGSLPAAFDMKHAGSFYSPRTLVLNLACAEMMAFYKIPHCGTSGSGNGWGADLLAATTLCINHLTSCSGAVGMVPFVGGSFDSLVFSPELVVYSDDLIYQSRQFAAGFSLADDHIGFSDINTLGPGGNFLLSSLTGRHFRESQFSSTIWPFLSLDKWRNKGAPTAAGMLQDKTCNLLANLTIPEDHDNIMAKGEAFLASV